ncbi:ferric reductase-like transmembrane domain-containing protein [uncultured Tateyamaria sp.]|uniref:sulfite oxidase heme-binding subunit YedZ n=1 Tax=uncultured Tateyamaria sp. TaxID=455651 RepID=UPI00261FA4AB|nr:ferric reductase-like transmembrane domain-containing protein [uncultured Tateyamaria sp.]
MTATLLSGTTGPDGMPMTQMLLHPTGEFSARFLIIAMMLTPLRMLFPSSGFVRWLIKRRRYIGMAAFFYALLHTLLYLVDMGSLRAILGEFLALGIWTGWLAMVIFVPLAVTSTDGAVRRLGPRWKTLQRFVYIAAAATLVHWIFVHNNLGPALVHFLPLATLETYRAFQFLQKRNRNPQET